MKIRSILLSGLIIMAIAGCESSSGGGGGGGLFGGGGGFSTEADRWDMMLMPQAAICPDGFTGRGASVNPTFPGGYFPGVKVLDTTGIYNADIPEVKILAYITTVPLVTPGDRVRVRFNYLASADGEHGDYFLVRIIDGDKFRVPLSISNDRMIDGVWRSVDFSYQAETDSFVIEFIVGLSSTEDSVRLDNLRVKVDGLPLIDDHFEWGDYTGPLAVAPAPIVIYPFLPPNMKGTIGLDFMDCFEGEGSLLFTGGSYFVLDGFGGSFDGYSGVKLSMYDETMAFPFHGQMLAMQQQDAYTGYFDTEATDLAAACNEYGSVLVSVDPQGNADLSGAWNLSMLVECEEAGLGIVDLGTMGPAYFGSPTVARTLVYFTGAPFTTAFGDNIVGVQGLTLGNAGFFMFASSIGTTTVLQGAYDKTTGVYAGQVAGTLPVGGMTCTVKQGQFMALIGPVVVPLAK